MTKAHLRPASQRFHESHKKAIVNRELKRRGAKPPAHLPQCFEMRRCAGRQFLVGGARAAALSSPPCQSPSFYLSKSPS